MACKSVGQSDNHKIREMVHAIRVLETILEIPIGIGKPIIFMRNHFSLFLRAMPAALVRVFLMVYLAGGMKVSAQVVTNTADSGPGTLRYAIADAANGAIITFASNLSAATITLASTLDINTSLTIDASALPDGIQISGNGSVEIFNVISDITISLNSLTLTNGSAGAGGGIDNNGTLTMTSCTLSGNRANDLQGGGIYNTGTLALNECTLSGNSTSAAGGGICNVQGTMTLNQCTLSGNSATHDGGGIYNYGTLVLNECNLSENNTDESGGGILNSGTLTITNCTLLGNNAKNGGGGAGIYNALGTLTLYQCTLSDNNADSGACGGIYIDYGTLTLDQCTLSGNSADYGGGGIENVYGVVTITNTIVAGNSAQLGADILDFSTLTYGGSNIVQSVYNYNNQGTINGPTPLTNAPDLAPPGNYGGPTQTMPPLPDSPAIGAGSVAANSFATDQRGYPRMQNGRIDIGAVEVQSRVANPPVLGNITMLTGGGANGLQFTFTNAPAADFTVLTATDVSLALTDWTVLGEVQQVAPGQYQFTDPQATTNTGRFYRVRSP